MKRFKYLTLAALVAIAACDEGTETVVTPPVTGSVSGVVTIEGVGASGVTVTLSSGASATTDGSGAYSFSGVTAGAYTVTISGFASDATFSSSAKAVTISSAGQVATANFDGSFVRTSAILGSVAAGGTGLANVSVSLSGQSSSSTTTDSNGQYAFSGLRAGSYTVTMSNPNSGMYSFTTTSSTVSVGAGASQIVSFSGSLLSTAMIAGRLYIDEDNNNDTFDAGLEANLSVANIGITVEGGAVNNTWVVQTAADGTYSVPDLAAGTYRVTIDAADVDIPGMVTYGLASAAQLVTVTTGSTGTVNFPFNITTQTIKVGGFLGTDATGGANVGPMQAPVKGWTINLYDTQTNAAAGGATGRLGSVATGADGWSTFRFARSLDVSPASSAVDNVVFAQIAGAPSATHAVNGETILEIKYAPTDSVSTGADVFDALYNALTLKVHAAEIDMDTLAAWSAVLRVNKDSTFATTTTDATDANGDAFFNLTPVAFPDTLWVRLSNTQAGAGGHAFASAATMQEATLAKDRWLRYIWNGTVDANDTLDMGDFMVSYKDVAITVMGHHEKDDTLGVTAGDDFTSVIGTQVQLNNKGKTTLAGAVTAGTATGVYGAGPTWANVAVGSYDLISKSNDTNVFILDADTFDVTPDGSDQTHIVRRASAPTGAKGNSAIALKTNNNFITGTVAGDEGTGAKSIMVTMTPFARNIEGTPTRDTTTATNGTYTFSKVIEGQYTVSVQDIAGTWQFFDTLKTAPTAGSAGNKDQFMGERDVQGYAATRIANFQPDAMDTKISGVIVNDRDSDFNTLDPDEALSGVTVNLIDDADGDGAIDAGEATLATTITDPTGAFTFTGLREDFYIVQAVSPSNAVVLRALSAAGAVTQHAGVRTRAGAGACVLANCTAQSNTKTVGNVSPPAQNDEFPRWSYTAGAAAFDGGGVGAGTGPNSMNAARTTAPANFVHLFNTGVVQGKVFDNSGTPKAVLGARVTITRCQTAATAPSPPAIGSCTVKHGTPSPHIQNVDTDASGNYVFTGLLEGVYQVDVAPATAGYTNIVVPGAPGAYLATLQGNNDIETVPNFTIS